MQDQVLLLVDFDRESMANDGLQLLVDADHEKEELALAAAEGHTTARHGKAIALLVEHTHSIPVRRWWDYLKRPSLTAYSVPDCPRGHAARRTSFIPAHVPGWLVQKGSLARF